jgi:hypothetical protein
MMAIRIRYRGPMAEPQASHRAAGRAAFDRIGRHWFMTMRPKHFTEAGAREYGYAPRKGEPGSGVPSRYYWRSYIGRKRRRLGHRRPLEFTGESKRAAGMGQIKVSSMGKFVKIIMSVPNLNFRHPASKVIAADELTRISLAEQRELADMFDAEYERVLESVSYRELVKILG